MCQVWCSSIQGIYARLTRGVHLPWVYVNCLYIERSAMRCTKFGVVVFKASVFNCGSGPSAIGICELSIYREICHEMCQVLCSGDQGIYAQLTVGGTKLPFLTTGHQ